MLFPQDPHYCRFGIQDKTGSSRNISFIIFLRLLNLTNTILLFLPSPCSKRQGTSHFTLHISLGVCPSPCPTTQQAAEQTVAPPFPGIFLHWAFAEFRAPLFLRKSCLWFNHWAGQKVFVKWGVHVKQRLKPVTLCNTLVQLQLLLQNWISQPKWPLLAQNEEFST